MKKSFLTLLLSITLVFVLVGFAGCDRFSSGNSGGEINKTSSVTSVAVTPGSQMLTSIGETVQLSAEVIADNEIAQTVTWSSSNNGVAVVNSAGIVTAIADGTATITATSAVDVQKKGTATILVDIAPESHNVASVTKYEVMSYEPQSESERVKYSYSYDNYDCYYIYLGEMANIPIYYQDAEYHSGVSFRYVFSTTTTTAHTIEETVTSSSSSTLSTTDSCTTSTTTGGKISSEISSKMSISAKASFLGLGEVTEGYEISSKIGAEQSFSEYVSNSSTNGFQETKSLQDTIKHATTKTAAQTITKEYNLTKADKVGYYRYTYFSTADVYLYIVKDSNNDLAYYEFKENVIPDLYFWRFDYSETPSFRKSDATTFKLDLDALDIDNLPKPTLVFDTPPEAPFISFHPQSVSAVQIGNAMFTVKASGNPEPEYQWQVNAGAGGGWSDLSSTGIYTGATTDTLTLSNVQLNVNGYQYRCIVSNIAGNLASDPATLNVNPLIDIVSQPQNRTIAFGQNTTFTISAIGIPEPAYQWQVSINGGTSFSNITNSGIYSGTTTATLSLQNVPPDNNGYKYRCVVKNSITATSEVATLTVIFTTEPMVVAGARGIVTLKSDGTVWTWGYNGHGELGDGTTTNRVTPVQVKNLCGVTMIATGTDHVVALKWDGTVWAWGSNSVGQLGDGTTTTRLTPVQVNGIGGIGNLSGISAIDVGAYHTVAIKSDGTVLAWGENSYGQLGDGTTTTRTAPVQVKGIGGTGSLTGIKAIAVGSWHTVALQWNGTVCAWGSNSFSGMLGDGTTIHRSTPVQVKNLSSITFIAAGWAHTVALKLDGTVWVWGYNGNGQLGDGTTKDKSTPVQVKNLTGVISVSLGESHTVALKVDGTVWAWGGNSYGQLGDGTTTIRTTPVQVKGVGGTGNLTGFVIVSASTYHTIALQSNGTVCAWGDNCYGQLGDGTMLNQITPIQVKGGATGDMWLNLLS